MGRETGRGSAQADARVEPREEHPGRGAVLLGRHAAERQQTERRHREGLAGREHDNPGKYSHRARSEGDDEQPGGRRRRGRGERRAGAGAVRDPRPIVRAAITVSANAGTTRPPRRPPNDSSAV